MSLGRLLKLALWTVGVLILLIAATIVVGMWSWIRPVPMYRFPVPPETVLTEAIAIEFSKKAMVAEGWDAARIYPTPYNNEGRYFSVNTIDPNSGSVVWATPQNNYGVRVEKEGQQIVCRVYRNK